MANTTTFRIIAIWLAAYGIYMALFIPPMLTGPASPLLFSAFLLQVITALAAAVGVWGVRRWAPGALMLLGLAVTMTEVVEGFVLGIVAYNYALLVAVVAMIVTIVLAMFVARRAWRVPE